MTKLEETLTRIVERLEAALSRPAPTPVVAPGQAPLVTMPEGLSLTKQADAATCDINVIMARYEKSGVLPFIDPREPRFGDFSNVEDYHSACNRVNEAWEAFDAMPAEVRSAFDNDPAKLIEALDDPGSRAKLEALGLVEAKSGDLRNDEPGGVRDGGVARPGGSEGAPGGVSGAGGEDRPGGGGSPRL